MIHGRKKTRHSLTTCITCILYLRRGLSLSSSSYSSLNLFIHFPLLFSSKIFPLFREVEYLWNL